MGRSVRLTEALAALSAIKQLMGEPARARRFQLGAGLEPSPGAGRCRRPLGRSAIGRMGWDGIGADRGGQMRRKVAGGALECC